MAKTLNSDNLPMGLLYANGKQVVRKSAVKPAEEKKEPERDEAEEHRCAMLEQAKYIANAFDQNTELLILVGQMIKNSPQVQPLPAPHGWEFTIVRDDDDRAKIIKATPIKIKI